MTNEKAGLTWQRISSEPEEREPRSRLLDIAHAVLLLMGLAALIATGWGAINHIRAGQSTLGLELEISGFQFIDDDNQRAVIRFNLHNNAALAMEIDSYFFYLLLNGERVGTSFAIYRGTDPNEDLSVHSRAATIRQTLSPQKQFDLEFTQHIHPKFMEIVRRAQDSGSMSWSTEAFFRIIPPFVSDESDAKMVELRADVEEGDDGA